MPEYGCQYAVNCVAAKPPDQLRFCQVYFSVQCGVRMKMTICPKKLGVVQKCAVKKTCDGWESPTLSSIWSEAGAKVTLQNGISAEQWAQITEIAQFRTWVTGVCAAYCGFF